MRLIHRSNRSFRVDPTGNAAFWDDFAEGHWEQRTIDALERHIDDDTVFLDIGAWIGPTTLFGAQHAKRTICFEPDPVAWDRLTTNLAANEGEGWHARVTAVHEGVAVESGDVAFGVHDKAGDSQSSALFAEPGRDDGWTSQMTGVDDLFRTHHLDGEKLFVKIDVEGGEYDLVPALMQRIDPARTTIALSLHTRYITPPNEDFLMHPVQVWKLRRESIRKHRALFDSFAHMQVARLDGEPFEAPAALSSVRWRARYKPELLIQPPTA